jgi:hypothetical protein
LTSRWAAPFWSSFYPESSHKSRFLSLLLLENGLSLLLLGKGVLHLTGALRLSGVVKRRQGQEEKRKSTDASSHYPYNVDE